MVCQKIGCLFNWKWNRGALIFRRVFIFLLKDFSNNIRTTTKITSKFHLNGHLSMSNEVKLVYFLRIKNVLRCIWSQFKKSMKFRFINLCNFDIPFIFQIMNDWMTVPAESFSHIFFFFLNFLLPFSLIFLLHLYKSPSC